MPNESSVLAVQDVTAGYGAMPIIHNLSLQVKSGECLAILGQNGMGKTTLIKTIVGHLPCSAGRISLHGKDVTDSESHQRARAGVGYVPQGRSIFPALTVRENIGVGAVALGLPQEPAVEKAIIDFPALGRLVNRRGGSLSGGEQQLLALARALAGGPRILLLDEPTEGIQPSIVDEIEDYLIQLMRDTNLTVVVVEQDIEFLARLSHRVCWLQKGQLIREFTPGELLNTETIDTLLGGHGD